MPEAKSVFTIRKQPQMLLLPASLHIYQRLASFLKCGSYIMAKKLYKKRNSFNIPDVLVM